MRKRVGDVYSITLYIEVTESGFCIYASEMLKLFNRAAFFV